MRHRKCLVLFMIFNALFVGEIQHKKINPEGMDLKFFKSASFVRDCKWLTLVYLHAQTYIQTYPI